MSLNDHSKTVCILCQFHNYQIVSDLVRYIRVVYNTYNNIEIYITMVSEVDIDRLSKEYQKEEWYGKIVWNKIWCNRGMDVGGFLWACSQIPDLDKYHLILKLHTKTDPAWRTDMLSPICGTVEKTKRALQIFTNPQVGMVSCGRWLNHHREHVTGGYLRYFEEEVFGRHTRVEERWFAGGTIFWVRASIIHSMIKEAPKFVNQCCYESDQGRVAVYPYAFERLFGYYTIVKGYKMEVMWD